MIVKIRITKPNEFVAYHFRFARAHTRTQTSTPSHWQFHSNWNLICDRLVCCRHCSSSFVRISINKFSFLSKIVRSNWYGWEWTLYQARTCKSRHKYTANNNQLIDTISNVLKQKPIENDLFGVSFNSAANVWGSVKLSFGIFLEYFFFLVVVFTTQFRSFFFAHLSISLRNNLIFCLLLCCIKAERVNIFYLETGRKVNFVKTEREKNCWSNVKLITTKQRE